MLKLPVLSIKELALEWKLENKKIETILHHGIFMCVHLSRDDDFVYILDGMVLRPIAHCEFYARYIHLNGFSVSHIDIEEDDIERVINTNYFAILIDSILQYGNLDYYAYIVCLLEDYRIMNTLYESKSNIHVSKGNERYKTALSRVLEDTKNLIEEIKGVISQSERDYPLEFGLEMLKK
jgi:hypothetical protein